jgi:hypothetical protein
VQGRVVRLSYLEGHVQISADGQPNIDQAVANLPLQQGNALETGQDGRAEIQLEDGSIVRLTPNSRLSINQLTGSAPGNFATTLNLLSGEAYFEARPASGDAFRVDALGLNITAPESANFRISWLAQPEQVAVSDGYIRVKHAGDYTVQVNANETLSIDDADVTRYLLSTGTDSDTNDAWNDQRDQYQDDAEARATTAQPLGDSAAEADLDNYGNYYDVPGVGEVWQPYGYDASWSPYDDGYWAWYPWGYTWVSAYPWGWAPYHCGYWNYFDGFGWGWVGGGCGAGGWYPVGGWFYGGGGGHVWHGPRRPPWRPVPPVNRFRPVGVVKDRPFQPVAGHPVPRTFKPVPVNIGGKTAKPLQPVPPSERIHATRTNGANPPVAHRFGTATAGAPRTPVAPVYGSRPSNPEMGRGANRPAPTQHSSPPPQSHSSPSASHSEGGSSHK